MARTRKYLSERIHGKYTVEPQNFAPESSVSQIVDHWSKECIARFLRDLLVFASTDGLSPSGPFFRRFPEAV